MFSAHMAFHYLFGIALLTDGIAYKVSPKFRKKIKEDKQIRTLRLLVSMCLFFCITVMFLIL